MELSFIDLQMHIQSQSILSVCKQYHDIGDWLQRLHNQYFPLLHQHHQQSTSNQPRLFQPSLSQMRASLTSSTPSTALIVAPPPPQNQPLVKLGKTRPYRTRSLVPGECNQGRTYAASFQLTIPETPTDEYRQVNINKDDRHFMQRNATIGIFQFNHAEWLQYANQCIKSTMLLKLSNYEPLMTYINYILRKQNHKPCDGELPPAPSIFGPKLIPQQKRELMDAFYWMNMHPSRNEQYKPVLFFYKLFGWFVRKKDGYRMTKQHDARQLVLKRSQLIQNGTIPLELRVPLSADRTKSARGRKRKINTGSL